MPHCIAPFLRAIISLCHHLSSSLKTRTTRADEEYATREMLLLSQGSKEVPASEENAQKGGRGRNHDGRERIYASSHKMLTRQELS